MKKESRKVVKPTHGIAMYGKLKYGPDFKHFDYVNPKAPKGGRLRLGNLGTFDSFHPFISKGNTVRTGSVETLMVGSLDNKDFALYGLIAESLEVPKDRFWVIFNLREQARWHDGVPITADDVVWSFETMMTKGKPYFRLYCADVEKVEKLGKRRVKFVFRKTTNRQLALAIGELLPILPQHYWKNRDFSKTTLEPPLGSGPYRIKDFEPGRYIVKERVRDYWGRDLPVRRGFHNFDEIRTDFYRDGTTARLALKSDDIDLKFENQSKAWVFDYNMEAVKQGWLKKEMIRHYIPKGMRGLVMNSRRKLFSDRNVRKALSYAFDFEWTNKYLLHSQYTRIENYFANSEMASRGTPKGEELKILNRYRDRLPPEVFLAPYKAPKTDGSGWIRENLKTAFQLLEQSGWVVRDMKLVHKDTGQLMRLEILIVSSTHERVLLPFVRNLAKLGVEAKVRLVDQSQYINRLRGFDFDMIFHRWWQSELPGSDQRLKWSSRAASMPGSQNLAGIRDPIVDELIELLIQAEDYKSVIMRVRALDRILLAGHYVIPNWYLKYKRVLYWNRFSRPSQPMKFGIMTERWWYDEKKARVLENYTANEKPEDEVMSLGPWLSGLALFVVLFTVFGYGIRKKRKGV